MKKKLIVIEGPTASGKTALGVELAKYFNTVIISADSRQFYKELEIGTAKPTLEEQQGIKHYFIDSHLLEDEVSSGRYANEVDELLKDLFLVHDIVLMVGGSGMFIDAVCIGLDQIPSSQVIRSNLNKEFEEKGIEPLLIELRKKDVTFFENVDKSNPVRIIRALEAIRSSGKTMTELRTQTVKKHNFEIQRFVINHPRKHLYERINSRVDQMIKNGLLDEVKSVYNRKGINTLKTVGYSEMFSFLDGEITIERAVELIKQNTRRYAKRQLTWFRRHDDAIWLDSIDLEGMVLEVIQKNNFLE